MTEREMVLDTLQDLFDEELPEIIRELNRSGDGLELKELTDTLVFGGSSRVPYAVLKIKSGEYKEKDRIIKSILFDVELDFFLADSKDKWRHEARYAAAVKRLIERHRVTGAWDWVTVRRIVGGSVVLSVSG